MHKIDQLKPMTAAKNLSNRHFCSSNFTLHNGERNKKLSNLTKYDCQLYGAFRMMADGRKGPEL